MHFCHSEEQTKRYRRMFKNGDSKVVHIYLLSPKHETQAEYSPVDTFFRHFMSTGINTSLSVNPSCNLQSVPLLRRNSV